MLPLEVFLGFSQIFERFGSLLDTLLNRLILSLPRSVSPKCLVDLILIFFQCAKLFRSLLDRLRKKLLLLSRELRIAGIELQSFFNLIELFLGRGERLVGVGKGFPQSGGITAELDCDASDFFTSP